MLTSRDTVIGFRSRATAVDFFNGLLGSGRRKIMKTPRSSNMRALPPRLKNSHFVAIFLATLSLVSCGSGSEGETADYPNIEVLEPTKEALEQGAVLKGTARFEGTVRRQPITMSADGVCQASNRGAVTEDIVVEDGKLRDVLVYVSEGLSSYRFNWEKSEAVLDQKACIYVPHVIAVRSRQPIRFVNSDATTHNVSSLGGVKKNAGFNKTMQTKNSSFLWNFATPELGIRVKCDIHPWMNAIIHVLDHPYFAITDSTGAFTMPRALPPGTYTLTALHPTLGEQTQSVTINPSEGAPALKDFIFAR